MDIGALIFDTDYSMRLDDLAVELEHRGYESLFVPEHTHIPTSRQSPWPGGGDLPLEYSHSLDPFVSLSFAAARTEKIRLGTGICLMPDDFHSIRIEGGRVNMNLHMYGRGFEAMPERVMYDSETDSYDLFQPTG